MDKEVFEEVVVYNSMYVNFILFPEISCGNPGHACWLSRLSLKMLNLKLGSLSRAHRMGLGIIVLLIVDVIWVVSSELTKVSVLLFP